MNQDELKKQVAEAALEYVESGTVIGVGTGSTANFFIDALAGIKGKIDGTVASSVASAERLKGHGIPVLDLNEAGELSVYIDGADESNSQLHLIKGGGGALTREKIVAGASCRRSQPQVRLHLRREQTGQGTRHIPAADRSHPHGTELCGARAGETGRAPGATPGFHHRQRQHHPRHQGPGNHGTMQIRE
jgi:hypothetical protein